MGDEKLPPSCQWDDPDSERERWQIATGCDTPEEAAELIGFCSTCTTNITDRLRKICKAWADATGCATPDEAFRNRVSGLLEDSEVICACGYSCLRAWARCIECGAMLEGEP